MTNVPFNVRGKLSALKDEMLAKINQYKAMPPMERLRFRLSEAPRPSGRGFTLL